MKTTKKNTTVGLEAVLANKKAYCPVRLKPILAEMKAKNKKKILATPAEIELILERKISFPNNKQVMIYIPYITSNYNGYAKIGLCPLKGWNGERYQAVHKGLTLLSN